MSARNIDRVGRYVIARRNRLGLTQVALAEAAGVDFKTVGSLESGQRWPIARSRTLIEEALGLPRNMLARVADGELPAPGADVSDDELRSAVGTPEFARLLGQRAVDLPPEDRVILDVLHEELRVAEDARRRLIEKMIRYSKGSTL